MADADSEKHQSNGNNLTNQEISKRKRGRPRKLITPDELPKAFVPESIVSVQRNDISTRNGRTFVHTEKGSPILGLGSGTIENIAISDQESFQNPAAKKRRGRPRKNFTLNTPIDKVECTQKKIRMIKEKPLSQVFNLSKNSQVSKRRRGRPPKALQGRPKKHGFERGKLSDAAIQKNSMIESVRLSDDFPLKRQPGRPRLASIVNVNIIILFCCFAYSKHIYSAIITKFALIS